MTPVHEHVWAKGQLGHDVTFSVLARPGEHPFLMLGPNGLLVSLHMRPEDAAALGRLLVKAGEVASWQPVETALLEACA